MGMVDDSHHHEHCWHDYRGVFYMVLKDGHIIQECCGCSEQRIIHQDHAHYQQRGRGAWR